MPSLRIVEMLELIDAAHGPRMVRLMLDGASISREFGPVGGSLLRREDGFEDSVAARRAMGKWLLKLQVAGYELGAHNHALIAEIAADPERPDAYSVYADWLNEHDDPRGELISVMRTREHKPEARELAAQELRLRSQHPLRFERASWGELQLVWRWGFVEGLRTTFGAPRELAVGQSHELAYDWGTCWLEQQLNSLRNHPSGRFVRRVVQKEHSFFARRQANGRWLLTREPSVSSRYTPALTAG